MIAGLICLYKLFFDDRTSIMSEETDFVDDSSEENDKSTEGGGSSLFSDEDFKVPVSTEEEEGRKMIAE